jgi:maleylacetate reductase
VVQPFVYDQRPGRVVFGPGRLADTPGEVERHGIARPMLVADRAAAAYAERVRGELDPALEWDEVVQHVPADLAARARQAATDACVDGVVCVGGGSATGLAKAIALSHRVPIVAVPTTYAGSEQTAIYGITAPADGVGRKETGTDPAVLPRVVIYDPELTFGLPASVTGPSAFNALAHAVEALYAPGHNPVVSALALEGVRAVNDSLPAVIGAPGDVDARGELLYGAYLCGVALGATSAGLHHKICHALGGMFDLVHADAHSVVLPHAIAFTAPAIPGEATRLAAALGADDGDAAGALWDLAERSGVPTRLADLKGADGPLTRVDLAAVAQQVVAAGVPNPRPYDAADIEALLGRAFDGRRP